MPKIQVSVLLCTLLFDNQILGFTSTNRSNRESLPSVQFSSSILFPHQFGGYDANVAAKWTPSQASEFVLWHAAEPSRIGMQLSPIIKNWNGQDLGEFLSRLFLGKVLKEENKIEYCPSHVRNPQWLGLQDQGYVGMKDLLINALPQTMITPEELTRCAHAFLLKEHRWPVALTKTKSILIQQNKIKAGDVNKDGFDSDSFATMGHSAEFAKVIGAIRKERTGMNFTYKDLIKMLTMSEFRDASNGYPELADFYSNLGIKLTPKQKVEIVENLCVAGWSPSNLAKFICSIDDADEAEVNECMEMMSSRSADTSVDKSNKYLPSEVNRQPTLKFPFTNSREASFIKTTLDSIMADTVVELKSK